MTTRRQMLQALVILPVVGFLPREAKGRLQPFTKYLPPGVYISRRCCERDHDGDGNCDRHPARVGDLVMAEFVIGYKPRVSQAPTFQAAFEQWQSEHPGFKPVGDVTYDFFQADHEPWLLIPAWKGGGLSYLHSPVGDTFGGRWWDLIDRARTLRMTGYFRQEILPPKDIKGMSDKEYHERWQRWLDWKDGAYEKLAYVVVRFGAKRE